MLPAVPRRFGAERIYLRSYQAVDGPRYHVMCQANRSHLARYESGNAAMSVSSEQDAEFLVRELAVGWEARTCFFIGAFDKASDEFVA